MSVYEQMIADDLASGKRKIISLEDYCSSERELWSKLTEYAKKAQVMHIEQKGNHLPPEKQWWGRLLFVVPSSIADEWEKEMRKFR